MNLLELNVNQHVIDRAGDLAGQFRAAQPFRHVLIDDFFSPALAGRLSENFPPFDQRLAINEDGVVGNKAVHEKIMELGPDWQRLDELVQQASFRGLISGITGISRLQYDPHYFGGGTHENLHGQGLGAHIDFNFHPVTRQHRRLNMIVYLSEEWRDEWGGSIQLHKDPYLLPALDEIVTITPKFNRCVIFETNEHSWHGFPRIELPEENRSLSRRSFALYYYTDTRPEADTGREHSTIYVDQHLSSDFHAGMEFGTDQLQQIHELLAVRDQHLKRLYENIKQLNAQYNELRQFHSQQQAVLESFQADIVQRQARLDELSEQVQASENARVASENALVEVQSDIEQRDSKIAGLSDQISELKSSTSWRITGPIRKLKQMLDGSNAKK
jgi:hypothetical protein